MDAGAFIARWRGGEGGQERANYALFLIELCDLLGVERPAAASAAHERNDYVFERAVRFSGIDGPAGHGRIDLYKRGHFVLEAKQSRRADGEKHAHGLAEQPVLPGLPDAAPEPQRGWDVLMRNARHQAARYARALPADHGWPPFLIVCDIGRALELFADFTGGGRNYDFFPDRQRFRITLDDLADPKVLDLLRTVWTDPLSLDPTRRSVEVTRGIAARLAKVSQAIERAERVSEMEPVARARATEEIALFLMRCLFSMFAEDVGLLPKDSFKALLARCEAEPANLKRYLPELWRQMTTREPPRFSFAIGEEVRYFNGGLFEDPRVFDLPREEIGELRAAADHDWRQVDPAIFGTLLEQALDPAERRRLGAHYTPRAYVERLVVATIIEPLRRRWDEDVLGAIETAREDGRRDEAVAFARAFHDELCALRVLDPACGTGNFLYVAMELMKRLEADVREVIADLGGQEALTGLSGQTIDPHNFLGLELNPRAAAIAEMVLWIGYLQWHFRNGSGEIADPVLRRFGNINLGRHGGYDAVLAHDGELPDPKRPGQTKLVNPRRPVWPEADYIVGNPPFLGKGAAMRGPLGDTYVEALWAAHPRVPRSADFVMYWWHRAAEILVASETRLKRFGLVTTNSITGTFNRRVVERAMLTSPPLHLVFAIDDHPWTKTTSDAAAVRIAMTVAELGAGDGHLLTVTHEAALDGDQPVIGITTRTGRINADLSVGADVTAAIPLKANAALSWNGMMLAGKGFKLSTAEAGHLKSLDGSAAASIIRPYLSGSELVDGSSGRHVIDLFGYEAADVRRTLPATYGHLLLHVKPERDCNRDAGFRNNWWVFGRPRPDLRTACRGLSRYIATTETSKHRTFQFIETSVVPDHMLICIASDDAFHLGVLSSRFHVTWALRAGGWLGVGNDSRYSKSRVFDPFPFPDATAAQRGAIRLLADELDATRKAALADAPDLTLTGLYNVREKIKAGLALTPAEVAIRDRGRVLIIDELHRDLDRRVADAYGWPVDIADDDLLTCLVALNAARAAEEARRQVRWLRPDYQRSRVAVEAPDQLSVSFETAAGTPAKPPFPRDLVGQTAAVMATLAGAPALDAAAIASRFAQGRRVAPRIDATLRSLARLGHLAPEGRGYRLRRAA